MHPCLNVDEILRQLTRELVASEVKATAVSLACCCKGFEDLVLGVLWESQDRLLPLLMTLPPDVWKEEVDHFVSPLREFVAVPSHRIKSFKRMPTKVEWNRFRKYAQEMRKLEVDWYPEITSDTFLTLQLRTANEPLLPKLKTFKCDEDEVLVPFIPLFLSRETTSINIEFAESSPTLVVSSIIAKLSTHCPGLEYITLNGLPKDPDITEAVSEMLLGCNRYALRRFNVDSPLTEEARNVLFQLPKLCDLWIIVEGRTLLHPVALPNLCTIDLEFGDHLDWLQGFRGVTLRRLENVYFSSHSEQIGDFLGEFKNVALTTSAPATLREFSFNTSKSWNPSYRSLLPFTQLRELLIEFSCEDGCPSRVDDDIIIDLARAMPELRILQLGGTPCGTSGGITILGLIALAGNCHLSKLRIHFETASLVGAATGVAIRPPSDAETTDRQRDCALTDLEVGQIPIENGAALKVAMALLQIFPHLFNIEFVEGRWEEVMGIVGLVRQIDTFVHHTRKTYFHFLDPPK